MSERIDLEGRDPATYSELDALAYMYPAVAELVRERDALRNDKAVLTGQLNASRRMLDALRVAGDALMTVASSIAYAWETDTSDNVMWAKWKTVGPAVKAWVDARRVETDGEG